MSAARVREKRDNARKRYDQWQASHSPKRVDKRVTNGAANDSARPAPPARKGRGQVGGMADSGEPAAPVGQPRMRDELAERRTLARAIRECPDDLLRQRYRRTFDREWGRLYGREVSA